MHSILNSRHPAMQTPHTEAHFIIMANSDVRCAARLLSWAELLLAKELFYTVWEIRLPENVSTLLDLGSFLKKMQNCRQITATPIGVLPMLSNASKCHICQKIIQLSS